MRIVVTGAGGMLGREVAGRAAAAGHEIEPLTRGQLDITDRAATVAAVAAARAEVVVNCAAWTDVDGAEAHEADATRVNGLGAGNAAYAARAIGARLVHVGSDYVFRGDVPRPRMETDPTGPLSAYGRSKLAGELAVAAVGGRALVVRSAWLYGRGGRNFVDTIAKKAGEVTELQVVADQVGSPTSTSSLATAILALLEVDCDGIVHYADAGALSWHELATAIVAELGLAVPVVPITTASTGRPAPRPAYSALATTRYEKLTGCEARPWRAALRAHLGVG